MHVHGIMKILEYNMHAAIANYRWLRVNCALNGSAHNVTFLQYSYTQWH